MDLNEIKKALYKEKPIAHLTRSTGYTKDGEEGVIYTTDTSLGKIKFVMPYSEKPEGGYKNEEPAQLLIRWIQTQ